MTDLSIFKTKFLAQGFMTISSLNKDERRTSFLGAKALLGAVSLQSHLVLANMTQR